MSPVGKLRGCISVIQVTSDHTETARTRDENVGGEYNGDGAVDKGKMIHSIVTSKDITARSV